MEFLQPIFFSYLCFLFIVVDLVCALCVFCVFVIITHCMMVSFLLGFLSMIVDFPYRSMSIMVVFHPKECQDLENSIPPQRLAAMPDQNSFSW